jgi:AraC-like DNA-binding protein
MLDTAIVLPIIESVELIGGPVELLLDRSGLTRIADDASPGSVEERCVWDFFDRSARRMGLPNLGLLTGRTVTMDCLGSFGLGLSQSLTLHDCLTQFCSKVNDHSSHASYWVDEVDSDIRFCRRGIDVIDVGRDQVEQWTILMMLRLLQAALGPVWSPTAIWVQASTEQYYREFETFRDARIETGGPISAIAIPKPMLHKTLPRINDEFIGDLRGIVRETLEINSAPIDVTAEIGGLSRRSLQRRLRDNGLTYSRLVSQVRLDVAIELLEIHNLGLCEVALRLGYRDRANFTRAFLRWTGLSPQMFRRLHFDDGPEVK